MGAAGGVVRDRNRSAPRPRCGGGEPNGNRAGGAGDDAIATGIGLSKVPINGDARDRQVGTTRIGEANV
jgi:hypothetical protein